MKPLQASKWLSCQMLIDTSEMASLFATLGDFHIAQMGIIPKGTSPLTHEQFLDTYAGYINNLKNGQERPTDLQKKIFASIFTLHLDHLYSLPIEPDKELLRISKPIVQLQHHQIGYSPEEMKFRPNVLSLDSLTWGIQFAYPQLVQDPETLEIRKGNEYPNSLLFHTLQKWVRKETIPTPFNVNGQRINVPMRLGKQCLSWINTHPGLKRKNIHVN